jgi:phage tail-like protein
LLASTVGRYVQLAITLAGDGRSSPKIRAMRVYYPRFSYLERYLPAVYREDRAAADFLDRWLANPEGLFTAIEGRIAAAEVALDPATAPPEYLDWLGGWTDTLLDPSWDDARRRLFLKFAWLLYKWRGSSVGLHCFLRLATEDCPEESIFEPLLDTWRACTTCGRESRRGFGLRIVEGFERRRVAAPLLGDPTGAPGPSLLSDARAWRPADGGSRLHVLFRQWLLCKHGPLPRDGGLPDWPALVDRVAGAWNVSLPSRDPAQIEFSPVPPSNPRERADWEAFAAATFEFAYPNVAAEDVDGWREFLARRYPTIEALNRAYGRTGSAQWTYFAAIPLPAEHELPADGTPFDDWRDFVSLALPIRRNAHRFTVLVPAFRGEDPAARAQRLQRVAAIVELEKPAHTSFDVRPFWALFQAGSARVGIDTVLGESSRFLPIVLDAGYLREGYLAEQHPWTATDRQVVGRDRLQRNDTWTSTTAAPFPTH